MARSTVPGRLLALAPSLTCVALVTGCDGSDSSAPAPVANVTDSQVLGSWRGPCETLDGMTSTRVTNEFTADGRVEVTTTGFLDSGCALNSFDLIRSGTYLEHTQVPLPDGGVQVSLDQRFEQNRVRPTGSGSADSFNDIEACGIDDWEEGVEFDIGDCLNAPGSPFVGFEVPFETYTIASEDRGRLFFGNEVSFAAWNRPTALRTTVSLIRSSGAQGDDFPATFLGLWRDPNLLVEGTAIDNYVLVGDEGQLTFLTQVPGTSCIGERNFSLFATDGAGGYRDAFDRFSFLLASDGDVLGVTVVEFGQTTVYERETDLVVDDLFLCRDVEP